MKERLIDQGVKGLIEGIEPKMKIYYVQWYDHITEIMETSFVYEFEKYLFVREYHSFYNTKPRPWTYWSCWNDHGKKCDFESESLDRDWTNESIKCVF